MDSLPSRFSVFAAAAGQEGGSRHPELLMAAQGSAAGVQPDELQQHGVPIHRGRPAGGGDGAVAAGDPAALGAT